MFVQTRFSVYSKHIMCLQYYHERAKYLFTTRFNTRCQIVSHLLNIAHGWWWCGLALPTQ